MRFRQNLIIISNLLPMIFSESLKKELKNAMNNLLNPVNRPDGLDLRQNCGFTEKHKFGSRFGFGDYQANDPEKWEAEKDYDTIIDKCFENNDEHELLQIFNKKINIDNSPDNNKKVFTDYIKEVNNLSRKRDEKMVNIIMSFKNVNTKFCEK